jgi:hypothetical protein
MDTSTRGKDLKVKQLREILDELDEEYGKKEANKIVVCTELYNAEEEPYSRYRGITHTENNDDGYLVFQLGKA